MLKYVRLLLYLFFWVLGPLCAFSQITTPSSRAVYQRNSANRTNVPVTGNCPANSSSVEARATPIQGGTAVDWTPISTVNNGTFSGQLTLQAGWYQLEVRSMSSGSQTGYWSVDRVGVGEVFIVSGQSNAQGTNSGPDASDDRVSCIASINGAVREYELPFQFRHLDGDGGVGPTNSKHFYGALGQKLVQRLNVPVLILGAAVGGTSSAQWAGSADGSFMVPDQQWWDGQEEMRPYRALQATINHYARRLGLRGILWFQGESDKGKGQGQYVNNIQTVINKTRSDLGYSIPWVISQTSWIDGGGDGAIRAAQQQLVGSVANCWAGPNTDNYGNEYRSDGTHFSPAYMDLLANLWNGSLTDTFFQSATPFSLNTAPVTITSALPAPARQYAGGHIYVSYMATGPQGGDYLVQLLSDYGTVIANLGSGTTNPIRVFLPGNLDGYYRVRVSSSIPNNTSSVSERFQVFQNGLDKGTGDGLTGTYYPNQDLAGSPAITRVDGPLDYTWISSPGSGMPGDNRNWSARWTGFIEAPLTGTYQIKSLSDDGSRIWINNQLIVNDWNVHPWASPVYGQINLEGGKKYPIRVELRQDWYAAQVKLLWILPNQAMSQFVPKDRLYTTNQTTIQSPVVNGSLPTITGTVGNSLNANAAVFSDPQGQTLTYSFANLPAGLTGSASTGAITGVPTSAGSGTYQVTATNTGGKATSTSANWSITTTPAEIQLPIVAGYLPTITGQTGTALTVTGNNFSDPQGLSLTYSYSGLPAGLQGSSSSFRITGTPTSAGSGTYLVTATNSAGKATRASASWSITTTPTNPSTGGALSATVVSYNCSTGVLNLAALGGNGSAVQFQANGVTDWNSSTTYTLDECGRNCPDMPPFVIKVRQSGQEGQSFTWSRQNYCAGGTPITPVVQAPTVSGTLPAIAGQVGTSLNASAAVFSDPQGQTLTYTFSGLPAGLTGNSSNGAITGAPTSAGSGTYQVTATNTGGKATSTSANWSITTTPAEIQLPIVAGYLPAITGQTGTALTVTGSNFSDPQGLVLTYTYSGLPAGLQGSSSSFRITGTPTSAGSGTYLVTATNSAGKATRASASWSITTTPTNPSTGGALSATVVSYNCSTGVLNLAAIGGNGTTVEFMAVGITGWNSATTYTLDECGRNCPDMPPFVIRVRQSGQEGQSYTWSRQNYCAGGGPVTPVISVPTVSGNLPSITGQTGAALTVTSSIFSDPQGQTLTYTYSGLPAGLQGSASSVRITGTPTTAGSGTYQVTATNTSGKSASASASWSITTTPTIPSNPSTGELVLLAPDYNCATGAITFKTAGGNGSTIEFMAIGITGWSSNPNQKLDKESITAPDTPPFTIRARQSGKEVTLIWSRQATCGAARVAAEEQVEPYVLYPNPAIDQVNLKVPVRFRGEKLELHLISPMGNPYLIQHDASNLASDGIINFTVSPYPTGMYLLRIQAGNAAPSTLKLIRQ